MWESPMDAFGQVMIPIRLRTVRRREEQVEVSNNAPNIRLILRTTQSAHLCSQDVLRGTCYNLGKEKAAHRWMALAHHRMDAAKPSHIDALAMYVIHEPVKFFSLLFSGEQFYAFRQFWNQLSCLRRT